MGTAAAAVGGLSGDRIVHAQSPVVVAPNSVLDSFGVSAKRGPKEDMVTKGVLICQRKKMIAIVRNGVLLDREVLQEEHVSVAMCSMDIAVRQVG